MLSVDELIKSAVKDINDENESGARRKIRELIDVIISEQKKIAEATLAISKIRNELKNVQYEEVKSETIVG